MIFILESGRSDRFAKLTHKLNFWPRNFAFDVLKPKQAIDERVHELDHVIACHERFGKLPRSGPVFGKRNRNHRLRGFIS